MTSRRELLARLDPELRSAGRFLPRRMHASLVARVHGPVNRLIARTAARPGTQVVAVSPDVTVRVQRPSGLATPAPAVVWLHGGGFVFGTATQDDRFCQGLAEQAGVAVVAVEYRLLPSHPYPAALEDAYAALTWLAQQPWADASRLGVAGASAGGGLAAALALHARDRGEIALASQALVYPMLDDRTTSDRDYLFWSVPDNAAAWRMYLRDADPDAAVPARRDDLAGLPPAWVGCGTEDLFLGESQAYARRLIEAGVPTTLELAPGAFHAFEQLAPEAAVSQKFIASLADHLRRTLA